jgi:hypothetical protein
VHKGDGVGPDEAIERADRGMRRGRPGPGSPAGAEHGAGTNRRRRGPAVVENAAR